jgi:FixJ family two-component response regulator
MSAMTTTMTTVFVIDDQQSVRHALAEMLGVFGFTVETYDSATSFLAAYNLSRPGCIVADVRMPGMDGIELVRELARRRVALPVVLISGHADVPMAVAAIKAGAEDFSRSRSTTLICLRPSIGVWPVPSIACRGTSLSTICASVSND